MPCSTLPPGLERGLPHLRPGHGGLHPGAARRYLRRGNVRQLREVASAGGGRPWTDPGQTIVKPWLYLGQTLARPWLYPGQTMARYWPDLS